MTCPLERFYNINRTSLSIIGMWPYQDKRSKLIRLFLGQVINIGITIPHIVKLFTMDMDTNTFLEIVPMTMISVSVFTAYYIAISNIKHIKIIWNHMKTDWNELTNTREMNLLGEYATNAKFYNTILVAWIYVLPAVVIAQMILPVFLDIVKPLNGSRPFVSPFPIELFIDERHCFFLTIVYISFGSFYLGIITLATYGSFMIYVQHACGMFHLVWYTLYESFEKIDGRPNDVKEDERVYRDIVRSIKIHRRAIEFIEEVNFFCRKGNLLLLLILSCIIGTTIIRLFRIQTYKNEMEEMIMCILSICVTFTISFIGMYICQNVINQSSAIFEQTYTTPWYILRPKTQQLLLMLMVGSSKPYYVSMGTVFVFCNEFFVAFLQTTLSYTMVIYSLQSQL